MPLVVPYATEGGPAHPDKQSWWNRWWEVVPGMDDSPVLQGQMHKTVTMLANFFRPFVDVDERQREVRRTKGDFNLDPYRIIIRYGPDYLTPETQETLKDDWALLAKLTHGLTAADDIVSAVLARMASDLAKEAPTGGDKARFEALVREIQAINTFTQLQARFRETNTKDAGAGTWDAYHRFEFELLRGRATRLRQRELDDPQAAAAAAAAAAAPAQASNAGSAESHEPNGYMEIDVPTVLGFIEHIENEADLLTLFNAVSAQAKKAGFRLPNEASKSVGIPEASKPVGIPEAPKEPTPAPPPPPPAGGPPPPPPPPPAVYVVPVFVPPVPSKGKGSAAPATEAGWGDLLAEMARAQAAKAARRQAAQAPAGSKN